MFFDVSKICMPPSSTINEAIRCLDRLAKGIVLVTDPDSRLLGTITDGDIRRAFLAGIGFSNPVTALLEEKQRRPSPYAKPIVARKGTKRGDLLKLLQKHHLRQIPILDAQERVLDLVSIDDLMPETVLPLQAVIMAGGFGTRLRPLTESLPKPMLPVGNRPVMGHMLANLKQAGIQRVNVTTHYLPEKIQDYFGDGKELGLKLNYVQEDQPLGTAGALGLLEAPKEPFLVINGDILTQVDFRAMLSFHKEHNADLTVAVRQYDLQVPYGVIECDGPLVSQVREKPSLNFLVNAGIYLLEPNTYDYIPSKQHFNMTDLITRLIAEGRRVVSFPIMEYWLDIGQPGDYEQAQKDIKKGLFK